MNDATAGIVIISLSLAIAIFVGVANFAYGWGAFFLCVAVFTTIYSLIKAVRR